MKISMTSILYVLFGLVLPAASISQLRGGTAEENDAEVANDAHDKMVPDKLSANSAQWNALSANTGPTPKKPDEFTGDPALAIVASAGGGDYYTKAWTGENVGDSTRGDGTCTAWRSTLKCNPSGIRDPEKDKGCTEVIGAYESGFCECGNYAQFAAVDCHHRPFTCEVMCLKFAVIMGKPATYRGTTLSHPAAKQLLDKVMWANQTDLEAMRAMSAEVKAFMTDALQKTNQKAALARESMEKFMTMMRAAREKDANAAAQEMENYRQMLKDKPWLKIWKSGQKMIDAGQAIQEKVRETLPFDPVEHKDKAKGGGR